MNIEDQIGRVVRGRRAALRISQRQLAHRAKLQRTYISKIENGGAIPRLNNLAALAEGLETTVWKLVRSAERLAVGSKPESFHQQLVDSLKATPPLEPDFKVSVNLEPASHAEAYPNPGDPQ